MAADSWSECPNCNRRDDCDLQDHCKEGVLCEFDGGTFNNPCTEYIKCEIGNTKGWKIKTIEPYLGMPMACG